MVEKLLSHQEGEQAEESQLDDTVVAPARRVKDPALRPSIHDGVEVLARLPRRDIKVQNTQNEYSEDCVGDIIAVQQGNVIGTSFHPELTGDSRMHSWWLSIVEDAVRRRREISLR